MHKANKLGCAVCGELSHGQIFDRIREEMRAVLRCDACGFVWLARQAAEQGGTTEEYYNSEEYVSRCYEVEWDFDDRKQRRKESLSATIDEISRLIREKGIRSCLEVGASVGAVIEGLAELGSEASVQGVELNAREAEYLAATLGEDMVYLRLDDPSLEKEAFGLVYGIHVFEHFEDPLEELARIHFLLKPGGYLYLELPNHDDFYVHALQGANQENYKEFMYHAAHPYYYSRDSLTRVLQAAGFTPESLKTRQDYPVTNFFH